MKRAAVARVTLMIFVAVDALAAVELWRLVYKSHSVHRTPLFWAVVAVVVIVDAVVVRYTVRVARRIRTNGPPGA